MTFSRRGLGLLFALSLVGGAVGCSKCGEPRAASAGGVERVLPARAELAVVAPSLLGLGSKVSVLEQLKVASVLAQLQNVGSAKEYADALIGQLGVDIRSAEAMQKVGLDPNRSAGAAVLGSGANVLALPVSNEGRFADWLSTFARQRLGTVKQVNASENGVTVHRLVTAGEQPRLEWAMAHGYALVAESGAQALSTLASLPEADSLAKSPAYAASRSRLPQQRDVVVLVPPGAQRLLGAPIGHLALSLFVSTQAFTIDIDAPLGDESLGAIFAGQPAASLLSRLPDDAFLVTRFTGDASRLKPFADVVIGPYLRRAFAEGGFDVKAQVLDNLKPGAVLALSVSPSAKMGEGMPELDVRRTNPFAYVHLSGVAPAKSADSIPATLDQLAAVAPKFGATIEKKPLPGIDAGVSANAYVTRYAQGEGVHFAPGADGVVLFASPLSRLSQLAVGAEHQPVRDAKLRAVLDAKGLGLVVDLRKLAESVKALPEEAWGLGGFAIKATTVRWLDATDDLRAVTLWLDSKGQVLSGRLSLELGQPAP